MPTFIHTARAFFSGSSPFAVNEQEAVLEFHPRWAHVEPLALSMIAAWGGWCRQQGLRITARNLGRHVDYAARMKLFQYLGIDYNPGVLEHEEAGRFLPLSQVRDHNQLTAVIANISALLHLDQEPDSLAAVQYCVSEMLRNVLEHAGSPDGAFVCAHRYTERPPHRVTIGVADCGRGIARHLGAAHPEALTDDRIALGLAMRPGITGARPGMYGTPDNAGAGLFITRCIAKGTGGYFLLMSGDAAYRLRRARTPEEQTYLRIDPYDEPRHDRWELPSKWQGTVVTVEIRTDRIADFQGFFQWIRGQMPRRASLAGRIRFT
jgi:anti-sigma regulatory factor (Ser/Thr protein kinase)